MIRLSVTGIIRDYHYFNKDFWLSYKTLEKVLPKEFFDPIKMKLLKSKKIIIEQIPGINKEQFEIEKALLQKEWDEKNEEAKQVGTSTHEWIHNMFCTNLKAVKKDLGIDTDAYPVEAVEQFLQADKGIFTEFKMEIPLDDDFILIGIADCVIKDGKKIIIIDWKTDEKIQFKSQFDLGQKRSKRLKYPLSNLDDCPGVHYQIQLSLYAKMLQMLDSELEIEQLLIVQLENMRKKQQYSVQYLKDDVEKLLKWHLKSSHLKIEMNKCNELEY